MGERVELNAMTSDQFVEWLEQVARVWHQVDTDNDTLAAAYRRGILLQRLAEEQENCARE
jgi:hypothetical protein